MDLLTPQNTWMHYIGKQYTIPKFLKEAKRYGVSRRIPAQIAKGMNFKDIVVLLRWEGLGKVSAFAEMMITGLTFDHEIAEQVGKKLQENGQATYAEAGGGGVSINRECGSFSIGGTWTVTASIPEIMALAEEANKDSGKPLFVMLYGSLAQVYDAPQRLTPAPSFTRGFIRCKQMMSFAPPTDETAVVVSIANYRKREKQPKTAIKKAFANKADRQRQVAFA